MRLVYQGLKHKVLRPYSQALPIHAKPGRERDPKRLLVYGAQDDEF
jgi:hypothetical protein